MRIVFLSRYQNSVNRGAETFVKELSKRLSEKMEVQILSENDSNSFSRILSSDADVIISINGNLQSLKASLGRILKNYKLIITGQAGIGRGEIWNIFVTRPDIYVALTQQMENWAKKWAWGSKLVKIPNGVDLEKFTPFGEKIKLDLEKPIILSVGALVWYKNHDRVIKAVSKLSKGSLLIVGEGEKKEELNKLAKLLLGDRFQIRGFDYSDMPKVYRSCDLFTLPSWEREAFGIAYLEAMACGLGIVAPDDEARKEIIGESGLFLNTRDIDKYADMIRAALKKDWKSKARNQVEKFSWDKVAQSYEKLIEELIK